MEDGAQRKAQRQQGHAHGAVGDPRRHRTLADAGARLGCTEERVQPVGDRHREDGRQEERITGDLLALTEVVRALRFVVYGALPLRDRRERMFQVEGVGHTRRSEAAADPCGSRSSARISGPKRLSERRDP